MHKTHRMPAACSGAGFFAQGNLPKNRGKKPSSIDEASQIAGNRLYFTLAGDKIIGNAARKWKK